MSFMRSNDGKATPHLAIVEFFVKAEENAFQTRAKGRPVFDDIEFVRIVTPGDKHSVVEERAKDHHRQQYRREYEAFKNNEELGVEGMPLSEWPPLSPAMVANLRALNIRTVEQLAAVGDNNLDNIGMGARTLREKAKMWLEQAAGGEPISRLQAELDAMKAQREIDQKTIAELSVAVSRLKPMEAA